MKKIKNKILSVVLAVAMITTILPMGAFNTVFAADPIDVTTTGLNLSGGSVPLVETTYQAGSGTIVWSPTTKTVTGTSEVILSGCTITLNNATIDTANNGIILPTLFETGTVDISLVLNGDNTITSSGGCGITYHQGVGTIPKSFTISQGTAGASLQIDAYYSGIFLACPVTVASGILSITAQMHNGIVTFGPDSHITINSGTVDIVSKEMNAIFTFNSNVNIAGGSITLSGKNSIKAGGTVALSGTANINTTNNIAVVRATVPSALSDIFTKDDTITGTVNNVKVEVVNSTGDVQTTYNMDGTLVVIMPPVITIDGVEYQFIGDITNTGVDLADANEPPVPVAFKAGDGYLIYNPTTATLTLNNAVIENEQSHPLINLPLKDVKIKLVGENLLANLTDDYGATTSLIEQGGSNEIDKVSGKQTPENYSITVSGTGALMAISRATLSSISTLGTFVMESGTIKNDVEFVPPSFGVTDFKMRGGSIVSCNLYIFGDATITGGTILSTRSIRIIGNLTMSGGNVKCSSSMDCGVGVLGTIKKTGGVLNSLVAFMEQTATSPKVTFTLYDDVVAGEYDEKGILFNPPSLVIGEDSEGIEVCLNIQKNKTLTFPAYSLFDIEVPAGKNLSDYITNNGTFINNGQIRLPSTATKDDVMEVVRVLKPKGAGTIVVEHDDKIYSNSGEELTIRMSNLELQGGETATGTFDGYTFTGNNTDGYTLALDNLALFGHLLLPSNVPVSIQTNSSSLIDNGISFAGGYACNLTFTGSSPLTISGAISSATNGDVVNVQDGANVTVNGRIGIGGSGGADGTVNVSGARTILNVFSDMGVAIYCDTVNVQNGANVITYSLSRGINALDGGVNVTGGSTLTTNCDYGIYIIDGMLNIDNTSKLITNGAIAAFCVVDSTMAKIQSEVVALPGLPKGTAIASVVGGSATYWSHVLTGGELSVSNENSEPVNLYGAAIGRYVFQKVTSSNPGGDSGGGTADDSESTPKKPETQDTPITSEKPKPIISKPNPQTGDSLPNAFPIISILALALFAFGLRLKRKEK